MTWKDVKLATLQKMFSSEGTDINEDDDTISEYVYAMPYACNEALALLSTSNRYLRQSYETGENETVVTIEELPSFYSFGERIEAYALDDDGIPQEIDVRYVAGRLVFDQAPAIVYYNAWPETITQDTEDDYEFPLTNDVVVLLPLYMAAELYKDDDVTVATLYRNEFEAARAELVNVPTGYMDNVFHSDSGW